ncbi:hypothetical protein RHGRI_004077 [Rhododendron griersonianum]|uniref:Uncharacterized protein n=1 Tax=Rhododendron griersonianum TaxID=479676 RepID=A0AAV6L781_9ERIC|nr:hypothetical protein RHGRI_004077 [Rhododendron griersonianum]
MQGLFKDVGGMEDTGKRVKVWLDEMQDIERDIVKFLRQAQQENVTTTLWKPRSVFREWKTRQQIARKIECINDELWGISNRKWTYDIGKIEGRRSSEVEDQSEQEVESSTPTAVSYHESQEGVELLVLADFPLLKQHSDESQERVESLRRELKLMCALCDDANSMDEKNARLKVWTKQMQEVYEDARKFIDSYDCKIEQKGVSVSRIYRFLRFAAPREIDRIQNHICELSRRKWTYDIGGIQPRKGQSYVGKPSTCEARCMLISEPEAHCLSRSESAQPLSSHQIGRRNAFTRLFASVSMALDAVLPEPQLANSVEQLEENVKSIKEERSLMHSLLEDIGDLERFDGRLAWVKDMKDVSFANGLKPCGQLGEGNRWSISRVWIAKKIEDIMHKIQVLSDRRRVYGIEFGKTRKPHNVLNMAGNPHQRLPPSVHIKRRDIASFYDDLQAVVALLLTNNENRSIISIVGMEGIGKSTLVELLYENMAVRQHFTCNAWVSVHSDCNVEALMRSIEEQVLVSLQENKRKPIGLRKQDGKLAAEEAPVLTLSAILEVNRYLIVLDDVSTTEIWDRLIKEFPSTLHGSRIVLTTHDGDVATHADPKSVHRLRLLSDDDSWALFTKTLTVPDGLLERSRKMVMRCGGLPRAIVQLREQFGGTESTSGAWLRVLENPEFDQQPWKKTLDMMNSGLPLNLKRSLFYLGRFPVDFDISLRRLIVLWIAEGLVHQKRGDEEPPETVAESYLAELIDRNMVQVTKKKLNGAVKNCRLPYALREICPLSEPKKAEYPKSHTTKNSKLSPTSRKVLHLTHHSYGDDVSFHHILGDTTNLSPDSLLPGYKHAISFRSFDTREGSQPGKDLGKFLEHCISSWYFLSLRVLDLERVFRPELPKALGKLVLLRYLGLRWTYLDSLPSFIHKLLNLQTLDLKHTSINSLPTSIWKMEQLRHLYLDEDYRCRFVPRPSGYSLTDLQTLWSVFIDEDSPVKDGLDGLINLKRLGVMSRLMSSRQEAMLSQLEAVANWVQKLELLQSLRLKSFDKQGKPWQLPKLDLTGLTNLSCLYLLGRIAENNLASVLSSALTELSLSGSGLTEDPMPNLGELQHLRILGLLSESFVGKHMRCPSRGFPQLRILKLWKLEQLEEWTVENGALSNLIELEIRYCQNLKKLPNELRHSRTLQILLEFSNMPGDKYNFAETFNILMSQVREKLEKATISKSKKTFLWKIASDELPIGSRECPFCGAEPESAVHLFFLCKPVRMVWFAKWGLRTDTDTLSNISIAEWINNLLTPSLIFGDSPPNETDFLHFAVIFMEKIWLWRNKVAPDHVAVDPTQFMKKLDLFLKE